MPRSNPARQRSLVQGWAYDDRNHLWILGHEARGRGYTWQGLRAHLAASRAELTSKINPSFRFTDLTWHIHPAQAAGLVTDRQFAPHLKLRSHDDGILFLVAELPSTNNMSYNLMIWECLTPGPNQISIGQSQTGRQGDVAYYRSIRLPQV